MLHRQLSINNCQPIKTHSPILTVTYCRKTGLKLTAAGTVQDFRLIPF